MAGPRTENRIVLVTRRTRLAELIGRFNTESQARFYIEHLGADFSDYQREHRIYHAAVSSCTKILEAIGRLHLLDRVFLPNYIFGAQDIVVVLGQDGLVANTVKYLDGQPVLGVNPDPDRWDGALLPFRSNDISKVLTELLAGQRETQRVTMAEARLNNGQTLLAVNDLFIGPKSHSSAHYIIRTASREERHSSSGVIVSTGVGSTGWFKSLIAGALGVAGSYGGVKMPKQAETRFDWDARELRFTVREPFPSKSSAATLCHGVVTEQNPLVLESLMADNGVIFSDGIESDFLEFHSGTTAIIAPSQKCGQLVI